MQTRPTTCVFLERPYHGGSWRCYHPRHARTGWRRWLHFGIRQPPCVLDETYLRLVFCPDRIEPWRPVPHPQALSRLTGTRFGANDEA
jgi:hypothetical protein